MTYECVGITVVALVATASSLLHNLIEPAHQQLFDTHETSTAMKKIAASTQRGVRDSYAVTVLSCV